MNWAQMALERTSYKRVEVTIGGATGVAWVRRMSPAEHARIWGTVVAPIQAAADEAADEGEREQTASEVEAQIEALNQVVLACFYEDEDGERTDRALFAREDVERLSTGDLATLGKMVTQFSGLNQEVTDAVQHFPEAEV